MAVGEVLGLLSEKACWTCGRAIQMKKLDVPPEARNFLVSFVQLVGLGLQAFRSRWALDRNSFVKGERESRHRN